MCNFPCCHGVLVWDMPDGFNTVNIATGGALRDYYDPAAFFDAPKLPSFSDWVRSDANGIGTPVGNASSWRGIDAYDLVFWILPVHDVIPEWWDTIYTGKWQGRIVIVSEYYDSANNQDLFYNEINWTYYNTKFAPFIGISYGPEVVGQSGTNPLGDSFVDMDLTQGCKRMYPLSGGEANGGSPIAYANTPDLIKACWMSRNTVNGIDFVYCADSNFLPGVDESADVDNGQFLKNLFTVPVP